MTGTMPPFRRPPPSAVRLVEPLVLQLQELANVLDLLADRFPVRATSYRAYAGTCRRAARLVMNETACTGGRLP
jgi:hypothetical protein